MDEILDSSIRAELPDQILNPKPPKSWFNDWRGITVGIIILALVLGLGGYFLFVRKAALTETSNKVGLTITGSATVDSGAEAQFDIKYHNGEGGDMTNVHIDVIYPSNFSFKSSTPPSKLANGQSFDLPIVKEGKDGELVVRGIIKGATGEDKQLAAKLFYGLSNFNSTFEVDQTVHTTIQAPKLTFDITGPAEVPIGQDANFTLNYSNVSGQDYDNLAVSLIYPDNFKFTSASATPAKGNNYWVIGKLGNGNTGHINISGSFLGDDGQQQLVSGMLGQVISGTFASQIVSTATFKLKAAPLSIAQQSDPQSNVNVGDSIQITINYGNQSTVGLTNLIITDTLTSSNLIDTSKISVSDAVITGSTITWKAATNRNLALLAPGQQGQVNFSLPLKSTLPTTIKNQIVKSSVSVQSAEITTPIRGQDLELRVGSKLVFDVVGDFVTGAQPMQVGKESIFAITFLLSNSSNDLSGTIVTAALPLPPSAWNGIIIPDSEKSRLSFDPASGLIKWDIGDVPAFTGKTTPADKVTFQLAVVPQVSDQGQIIKLLSNIQASGLDSFTNQTLTSQLINQFSTSDVDSNQFQSTSATVQ